MNMKSKKNIIIYIIVITVFILILGVVYFITHYAVIDNKIYKNDIKYLRVYSLDDYEIKEINKCTKIKEIFLSRASENSVSKLRNFHNLTDLTVTRSIISSLDSEKINAFHNLKKLYTNMNVMDLKGFNSNTISYISLSFSEIKNLESLSECPMLKHLTIFNSIISDNYIVKEDNKYIIKDSSIFKSFDYIEELWISVDKIKDISGILEMDSLKEFKVDKGTLSEDDKKLLEDKGISVIYYDKNE